MSAPAPHRVRHLRLGALCATVFVILTVLVWQRWTPLMRLDRYVGAGPKEFTQRHDWMHTTAVVVAKATQPWVWVLLIVLASVLLFLAKQRRAALWVAAVNLLTWLITFCFKLLIDRPRPVWPDPLQTLSDPSYPSGHSSQAFATMGVAIVLTWLFTRRPLIRRLVATGAVLFILTVGVDRLFLGVHNLSDIVAGYAVAGMVLFFALAFFHPAPGSQKAGTDQPLGTTPVNTGWVGVVLNPIKVEDPDKLKALLNGLARDAGFSDVRWWETTIADTGHGMAHEAAVAGAGLVIAIGGDGTVRAVCEELAGTGIPVGIVPAGTGNLLARNLDIPLYLRAAVDVAVNGQDRAIDMVEVGGDAMDDAVFMVMAGMGLDAAIMGGVNENVKAKIGWPAYFWSGFRAMMFPTMRVEVSVDGGEFSKHRARTVVIGNVGFLQAGMPLLPDAAIDDGDIDVVLLYPRRFFSWVPLAARVLTKSQRTDELITRMNGREVVVRSAREEPRQLDGDLIESGREMRAKCVHGRLLVRVPR